MKKPRVSVVLPVYNAGAFVGEALGSVLRQTFGDFEVIVLDDGSSDQSAARVREESRGDERVRVVSRANRGLVATLNEGIGLARGDLIARMDADDVCLPERFARQVAALEEHSEVAVCGTWMEAIGDVSPGTRCIYPTAPALVKATMLFRCAVGHPSVMMRRELFTGGSRYDSAFRHAEDYALWGTVLDRHPMMNLGEVLMRYRVHAGQVSGMYAQTQREAGDRIRTGMLQRWGFAPTARELEAHAALSRDELSPEILVDADRWLRRLMEKNALLQRIDGNALGSVLCGKRWVAVVKAARASGISLDEAESPFRRYLHAGAL